MKKKSTSETVNNIFYVKLIVRASELLRYYMPPDTVAHSHDADKNVENFFFSNKRILLYTEIGRKMRKNVQNLKSSNGSLPMSKAV